ncbi:MAG: capsular biosynthesis protein [Dorea sp.]|nr:Wzz/FepE/Etk N-terminal domain-containing protein [uncultured Schaedlerella sp.]MCI9076570.1 capsular biosynthesis protein [Dorea sp.]
MQLEQEELEIDLKELFFELLSHWKILTVSTIMAAAIALVASKFILVPQYESTSALYVLSNSITSLADIQIGSSLTNDYIVVVKGRPILDQVIENLNLDETYDSLEDRITLENPADSRILEITVRDTDPNRAKVIADEMASVASDYISIKMDQSAPTTIQNGYADGEPVSPHVGMNTLIGAIVGFLLAAAIITISYLLDDTIMTDEDVEQKLGMNLLGSLPEVTSDDNRKDSRRKKKKKRKQSA